MDTLSLPKHVVIPTEEIVYLQSDSNYTNVVTRNCSKNHFVALSLCKIQAVLNEESFVRVNRSQLINISYLKDYQCERNAVTVTLKNNKTFRSSRRRTALVLHCLDQYSTTLSSQIA